MVQTGDRIAFMSETTESGIAYDFLPLNPGAAARIRKFTEPPVVGQSYEFEFIPSDTDIFALSVKVDTGM